MWEIREKCESGKNHSKSSALKSERGYPEKICFECGKPGHLKINCRSTWRKGIPGRGGAHGWVHWQRGAPKSQQQQQQQEAAPGDVAAYRILGKEERGGHAAKEIDNMTQTTGIWTHSVPKLCQNIQ
ncbi:hypothetical protein KM043_016485 [Ampulex compressa]|nr:hypothetical protein KM043_016485 [Ampulex compressa]